MSVQCCCLEAKGCMSILEGRHSRDHMVVGYTTTYAIGAYHH